MSHHIASKQTFHELDDTSLSHVVGGYLGLDQLVSEFPVWLVPYIDIAHVGQRSASVQSTIGRGQRGGAPRVMLIPGETSTNNFVSTYYAA